MARTVTSPEGVRWRVARQWAPWRVRLRRDRSDAQGDGGEGGDWLGEFGEADGIVAALGALVLLAVVLLLAWSILAVLIEAAVVVLGILVAAFGRVALRRPWTVRALPRGGSAGPYEWRVVGWRASGALAEAAAEALATGAPLPPGAVARATAGRGAPGPRRGA